MIGLNPPVVADTEFEANNALKSSNTEKLCGKLFEELIDWETNCNETIIDMVNRRILQLEQDNRRKTKVEFMLFKRMSDDSHLNLGLPTGTLKREKDRYECSFKEKLKNKTIDSVRNFTEEEFQKARELKFFYVKFEKGVFVSSLQKVKGIRKLMVPFFPGETLYEALFKDGRFNHTTKKNEPAIRHCDFLTENEELVSLSFQAKNYVEQVLKFKTRSKPNEELPLPKAGHNPQKAIQDSMTMPGSSNDIPQGSEQLDIQKKITSKVVKKLHSDENLIKYIEDSFGLKMPQESNKKDKAEKIKGKNERFYRDNYVDFALNYMHTLFAADVKYALDNIFFSIGAFISVNVSGVKQSAGTCFRIGCHYVITNNHVVKAMENLGDQLEDCYVDFNYKEDEGRYCFNIDSSDPLLVRCEELDYAILKLYSDNETSLPCSVIDNFNIAPYRQLEGGECLSLFGHPGPGELRKQINPSCPIKHEGDLEEHLQLVVCRYDEHEFEVQKHLICEAYNNPNSATYDVNTFFEGSSGSPGFLIQEKLLMVLHSRGIPYPGKRNCYVVEEGILMSSIVKDVKQRINVGEIQGVCLANIFGETTAQNFGATPMDID